MELFDYDYPNMGLIVAMGKNREIGYQNSLIWRIREDLKFFKDVTMNSYIIMGKNTYDSMPKSLSGRTYIVLSRNKNLALDEEKIVYHNIKDALQMVIRNEDKKFWVVGGGTIYNAFLPYVHMMHITQIDDSFENADTFFPTFAENEWYQKDGHLLYSDDGIPYKHRLLIRKK